MYAGVWLSLILKQTAWLHLACHIKHSSLCTWVHSKHSWLHRLRSSFPLVTFSQSSICCYALCQIQTLSQRSSFNASLHHIVPLFFFWHNCCWRGELEFTGVTLRSAVRLVGGGRQGVCLCVCVQRFALKMYCCRMIGWCWCWKVKACNYVCI